MVRILLTQKKHLTTQSDALSNSRARRIRTFKMTESESAALPFGYSPINICKRHICRLRIMIIEDGLRFGKSFFYFSVKKSRRAKALRLNEFNLTHSSTLPVSAASA